MSKCEKKYILKNIHTWKEDLLQECDDYKTWQKLTIAFNLQA